MEMKNSAGILPFTFHIRHPQKRQVALSAPAAGLDHKEIVLLTLLIEVGETFTACFGMF